MKTDIVLIHGFWVTPRSWERWIEHYEQAGHRVIAPAYPNAKHYKSDTITEVKEFEGPHLLPAWPGWEQVADYALDWALRHSAQASRA